MRLAGLSGVLPRKRRRTTVRLPGLRVTPDLVERDFPPDGPNLTWSADITYISTWEGFLYLAHVQDLFSRLIVGWSMADHLRWGGERRLSARDGAVPARCPERGLIHHSDMGSRAIHRGAVHAQTLQAGRHRDLDGLRWRLLQQRVCGNIPRQPQERAHLPASVANPGRGPRGRVRVHRGLVQPPAPALHPRLPLPSPVRATARRTAPSGAREHTLGHPLLASITPTTFRRTSSISLSRPDSQRSTSTRDGSGLRHRLGSGRHHVGKARTARSRPRRPGNKVAGSLIETSTTKDKTCRSEPGAVHADARLLLSGSSHLSPGYGARRGRPSGCRAAASPAGRFVSGSRERSGTACGNGTPFA